MKVSFQKIACTVLLFSLIVSTFSLNFSVMASDNSNTVTVTPFQTTSGYDLGIDAQNVRIGWKIQSEKRGFYQTAYHLIVREASTDAVAWDSGWVNSQAQVGIRPEGLMPETIYTYSVNIKDQDGIESGFSTPAMFETAPSKVEGVWLTSQRLLRKSFTLDQPLENVERARCYMSSTAIMQLRFNGSRIGDLVLGPRKSVVDRYVYYNTFDITDMLMDGENVVGAYVSYLANDGNSLCGMLRIYYKDGSVQTVATDDTWRSSSKSDVTRENYFLGEDIDATLRDGWDKPGYRESVQWRRAVVAGPKIQDGLLTIPGSNAGTYYTKQTFSGDYTIEADMYVNLSYASLEFGSRDGVPHPYMWQLFRGSMRIHYPGWGTIDTPTVPDIKNREKVSLKIEVKGDSLLTYINGKQVHTASIKPGDADGALKIQSAMNDRASFDSIKVTQNGETVFYDDFSTRDSEKWSYPLVPELVPGTSAPTVIAEYKPKTVTNFGSSYIVDFGQNMNGYVRLTTKGQKGTTYFIEYSEMMADNGDIFANTTAHYPTSTYTLSGGQDVIEPYYFFQGFRYVKVTISDGSELNPDDLTACFVSDDLEQAGYFASSNERLNGAFNLYLMSQRSCLMGNYSATAVREKNGWVGDASVTKEAAAIVLGDYSTADSFLDSMLNNINAEGRPQIVIPHVSTGESGATFDITWASAYFVFPYELYRNTGDTYYIERSWQSLLKIYEYAKTLDENGDKVLTHNVYGDWVGYDWHDGKLDTGFLSAAYFYYCGRLLSEMMDVIGEDHSELDAYLADMLSKLQAKYAGSDMYSSRHQAPNAIALDLGLTTEDNSQAVLESLKRIIQQDGTVIRTGVLGTKAMYDALSTANEHKILLDMTVSDKKGSFGYMLDNGATTLWEYWDKAGETFGSNDAAGYCYFDSQNHVMLGGSMATWLFEGLGGIVNTGAGYDTLTYRPGIESELSYVSCSIDTIVGQTVSNWTWENGVLNWTIEVPANTTATVIIPVKDAIVITESGQNILEKSIEGISYQGKDEAGAFVYTVGSGTYEFVASMVASIETSETEPDTETNEIMTEPKETETVKIPSDTETDTDDVDNTAKGCRSSLDVSGSILMFVGATAVLLRKRKEKMITMSKKRKGDSNLW